MKTKFENTLFYQIHQTAKFFDKLFEQFFKEINVGVSSSEHLILAILAEKPDCCQRDLAKIILKDRANVGKLANSLEKKELIEIELSQKNNRPVKILKLTKKAYDLLEETFVLLEPLKTNIEAKFQPEVLEEVKKTLHDFRNTVKESLKINI